MSCRFLPKFVGGSCATAAIGLTRHAAAPRRTRRKSSRGRRSTGTAIASAHRDYSTSVVASHATLREVLSRPHSVGSVVASIRRGRIDVMAERVEARVASPAYQAYQILHIAFTIAPIIAGIDK